jgi:hypothetical protein
MATTNSIAQWKRRLGRRLQKLLQRPIVIDLKQRSSRRGAFLISAPRSGSTLVRMILDSHTQIAAGPESHILVPLLSALKDERSLNAMWHRGCHRDMVVSALAQAANTLLESYAAAKGKEIWVEKTPRYVGILPELAEVFPEAVFLMLYRHPYDIVASLDKRHMIDTAPELSAYRQQYGTELSAYCAFVADEHRAMQAFQKRHPRRVLELRYESIVATPQDQMQRVCEFLQVDFEPQMCEYQRHAHDDGYGDPHIYRYDRIEKRPGAKHWTPAERDEAASWLNDDLVSLNYAA